MSCHFCSLSWDRLREMKDNQTEFRTAQGHKPLWIFEVDDQSRRIKIKRSTQNITGYLSYQKLEEVHNKVHNGEVNLDPYEIDELVKRWGNYITGLLRYLNCQRI